MQSIFLDPRTWDFAVDANGSIAVADEPYRLAQDAATAIRTFAGECRYDTTRGVPYFKDILDKPASLDLVRADLEKEALKEPGINQARVFFTDFANRRLQGQVQVTSSGTTVAAAF
jgi:hypothetical protein